MRKPVLVMAAAMSMLASALSVAHDEEPAGAIDPGWNPNQSSYAYPAARVSWDIMYPYAGYSHVSTGSSGTDDFCYVSPDLTARDYHNPACNRPRRSDGTNDAHKGNDLEEHPAYAQPALGSIPIAAAQAGQITGARNCIINQDDARYTQNKQRYVYLHNESLAAFIGAGARVHAGQLLGYVGDNPVAGSGCGTSGASQHLHFELHKDPTTSYPDGSTTLKDPYESLRQSAARPGLFANGAVD